MWENPRERGRTVPADVGQRHGNDQSGDEMRYEDRSQSDGFEGYGHEPGRRYVLAPPCLTLKRFG